MRQNEHSLSLMEMTADKETVETLYSKGLINHQGHDLALEFLYPHQRWGYWTANLLLTLGVSLVLVGIVFFFAFNWQKMTTLHKFSTIEAALLCCVFGSWAYSSHEIVSKLFLTGACVLVGVFLAVFGQIYQTGADSYQLFLVWAILITPWVILAKTSALWFIWIVLINTTLFLYWNTLFYEWSKEYDLLYLILMILNSLFLAVREYLAQNASLWSEGRWLRVILVLFVLCLAISPILYLIDRINPSSAQINTLSVMAGLIGLALHAGLLWVYIRVLPDMWVVALTSLSLAMYACDVFLKLLRVSGVDEVALFFLMSLITLVIFAGTAFLLRKINNAILLKG